MLGEPNGMERFDASFGLRTNGANPASEYSLNMRDKLAPPKSSNEFAPVQLRPSSGSHWRHLRKLPATVDRAAMLRFG